MIKLFKYQPKCPWCGKKAKKHTFNTWKPNQDTEPYKGNMMIVRTHYHYFIASDEGDIFDIDFNHIKNVEVLKDGRKRKLSSQDIWDGETYYQPHGHFCRTSCAIKYANAVAEKHPTLSKHNRGE